jgi:outer membrane biosynthesis protein TonB
VEPRQILRSGIMASAIVHLSLLMLVIFFAEVRPFGSVTAEPIAVDIVAPDEVTEKTPEPPAAPKKEASDSFDLSSTAAPESSPPPAASPQAAAAPQKQAALSKSKPAPSPVPSPAPAADQQPPAGSPVQSLTPSPAYVPAQPDLSIKYHVLLGLPQDRPGDGFDAPATEKADLASTPIAEFRRHLKTCSTLPKEVAASDKVTIKLRVLMTPDGRLAADPVLIEASASMKGPLLMQSAIRALQACQPFAMLPADKYNEWRILDLSFTPQDLGGAS